MGSIGEVDIQSTSAVKTYSGRTREELPRRMHLASNAPRRRWGLVKSIAHEINVR